MKFSVFVLLVAAVSAVTIQNNPTVSAKAREDTLATSLKVVAAQNKFEADHAAMHARNMDKAEDEAQAQKLKVRLARTKQVLGGDQYPPFKTYVAK
jgi:hypothetical protein